MAITSLNTAAAEPHRALVIEQINRSGQVIATQAVRGDRAVIGRALDCDVILQDPHVDPHHLQIARDPDTDALRCRDLGSLNGSWWVSSRGQDRAPSVPGKARRAVHDGGAFYSGQIFQLGKSWLRVSLSSHWVAPALPLSRWEGLAQGLGQWWFAGLAALLLMVLRTGDSYLTQPDPQNLYRYALDALNAILVAALYAGFWGFIGRHSRHEARFLLHFSVAVLALLAVALFDLAAPYGAFHLGGDSGRGIGASLFSALCLLLAGFTSVTLATRLGGLARASLAALAPLALILPLAVSLLSQADFSEVPGYDRSLVEPQRQLGGARAPEYFFKAVENLYQPWENDASHESVTE